MLSHEIITDTKEFEPDSFCFHTPVIVVLIPPLGIETEFVNLLIPFLIYLPLIH